VKTPREQGVPAGFVGVTRADDDAPRRAPAILMPPARARAFDALARRPVIAGLLAATVAAAGLCAAFRYSARRHQALNFQYPDHTLIITKPGDFVAMKKEGGPRDNRVQVADFGEGKFCTATLAAPETWLGVPVTMLSPQGVPLHATRTLPEELTYRDATCEPLDSARRNPAKGKVISELEGFAAKSAALVKTLDL
jgi:hypothetical protein